MFRLCVILSARSKDFPMVRNTFAYLIVFVCEEYAVFTMDREVRRKLRECLQFHLLFLITVVSQFRL